MECLTPGAALCSDSAGYERWEGLSPAVTVKMHALPCLAQQARRLCLDSLTYNRPPHPPPFSLSQQADGDAENGVNGTRLSKSQVFLTAT